MSIIEQIADRAIHEVAPTRGSIKEKIGAQITLEKSKNYQALTLISKSSNEP
jgi:hypothetical protein